MFFLVELTEISQIAASQPDLFIRDVTLVVRARGGGGERRVVDGEGRGGHFVQGRGKAGEDIELLDQPSKTQCFALGTKVKSPEGLFWGVE